MRLAFWSLLGLSSLLFVPACSGRSASPGDDKGPTDKVVQCGDYTACGLTSPCEAGSQCLAINGCGSAICANAGDVCEQACGTRDCAVRESYPGQIPSCPDGTPVRGTGEPSTPPVVGTGGGPSMGGSGAAIGGSNICGSPGVSGTAGSGGFSTGGAGPGPGDVIDCTAFERCQGGDNLCGVQGFYCVRIPGCERGICAPPLALCNTYCSGFCEVLESDPAQLHCGSNDIRGNEGDDPGLGGQPSFGGAPQGWAGEPALAGAAWGGENYGGSP